MSTKPVVKIDIDSRMPTEKALRKFKRKVEAFGVIKEYRKRKEYQKPSVKRKEKEKQNGKRKNKTDKIFDDRPKF